MNLSVSPALLKDLLLQRADEIESDFKRHQAATREIEQMPTGYAPVLLLAPDEVGAPENNPDQQERYRTAEQEYRHASSADSIARQVQWMRKVADLIGYQAGALEVSLDDLVTLNLWPGLPGRSGTRISTSDLRAVL